MLSLTFAFGCAGSSPGPAESSRPTSKGQTPPVAAPKKPKRLDDWATVSALPELPLGAERPTSLGHGGGRFTYTVHAEATLEASYLHPSRDTVFPIGATFVERLFDAKSGEPEGLFVMRKEAQGWRFDELDNDGFIRTRDAERCRRCHAEARADSVFGAPFAK
ncbi:MAG: hypothetical protein KC492_19450 [Myxococcales bacterium]|nr:hypothetical protein [Myxococcales bacterium]MCB9607231.1 hypothetical protein [Polyangiaceae bacterium]